MNPVFLFGSGADTDLCSKLKSGKSFSEALLLDNYNNEVRSLLGDNISKYKLIYPTSIKVFVQTIASFPEEAKGVLNDKDITNCINYYADKKAVDFNKIKGICKLCYEALMNEKGNVKIRDYFLKNAVFFDSLDEKFNSLRNAELNDSAKRAINAYTTIFVLMMKSLYNLEDFAWNYENVFAKLNEPYSATCESESYYKLLKDSKIDCDIVTTNYTNFVEKETGKKAIYLHGKMTWFEDLSDLSIYDCTQDDERDHLLRAERILPFILIPSGVKPLICTRQIKQFAEFIGKLESSNELCVIGYKFNSEDNHINSIIAEWLKKEGNKLVYFNYKNYIDFSKFVWANNFTVNSTKCISEINVSDKKIQNIAMEKGDTHKLFSDYLEMKKEETNVRV